MSRPRARVVVFRSHGQLASKSPTAAHLPQPMQNIAAVQIIAALRPIDPDARGIDVTFTS